MRSADGMQERIFINGRFLTQRITGIQRYARETLLALDSILAAQGDRRRWILLVPPGTEAPPLTHIAFRCVGRFGGHLWEQVDLPWHARDGYLLSFATTGPLLKKAQTVTVHDASVYQVPDAFSWQFRTWYRLVVRFIGTRSRLTLAVSQFAASEVARFFGVRPDRIRVTSEGWEHLLSVQPDASILDRHGLAPGSYALAVSSPTPNKNFAAVLEASRLLGDLNMKFVIAGAADSRVFAAAEVAGAGLLRVGYVSDAQLRALYENAMCFVFPSRYEGFGIPPLEAMGLGCPVVASAIPSVQEVCGDAAVYFDPSRPDELARNLRVLHGDVARLSEMRQRGRARAARYSWREAAQRNLDALQSALA